MLNWIVGAAAVLVMIVGGFVWSRRSAAAERGREERRAERQRRRVVEWDEVEEKFGGRHPEMRVTMDREAPAKDAEG